jgi:hypothetical protein
MPHHVDQETLQCHQDRLLTFPLVLEAILHRLVRVTSLMMGIQLSHDVVLHGLILWMTIMILTMIVTSKNSRFEHAHLGRQNSMINGQDGPINIFFANASHVMDLALYGYSWDHGILWFWGQITKASRR